jgi:hypothetical protein
MAIVKRITDLTSYTSVLPYASELFGVYQPLLGWKSKRIQARYRQGYEEDRSALLERLKSAFAGIVEIGVKDSGELDLKMKPGVLVRGPLRAFDSVLLELIAQNLPDYTAYRPDIWASIVTIDSITALLNKDVAEAYSRSHVELLKSEVGARTISAVRTATAPLGVAAQLTGVFEKQLRYESAIGGALLHLVGEKQYGVLAKVFYGAKDNTEHAGILMRALSAEDGAEAMLDIGNLDPRDKEHINSVVLTPISVVHLFRQYFFELDTFLGTPIGHVWLSPGSTVELIEISTRRTVTERTLENTLDILTKSEQTVTTQEEISDAVSEDNSQDVKFGASVTASYASISATSSFDYAASQKTARENVHKRMRQQTDKLSSEIRKNFKSSFKTVSEVTDFSSTKHTMTNSGTELINYELRRKMRQVGVQVQDFGTFLCWQTYVDDPGRELGLSKLIHSAKSPDLDAIPHPEEIPLFQPFQEERIVTLPFVSADGTNADNEGEVYIDGVEVDNSEFLGSEERIQTDFEQEFIAPKSDYTLSGLEFDPQGKPVRLMMVGDINNAQDKAKVTLRLQSVDFQGQNSVQVKVILHWTPSGALNAAIEQKNASNLANFKAAEREAYEKAFVETVKERVEAASRITTRNSEELREEERIVVYRRLIQEMLMNGVPLADDRTRHVVSELLNSIFDIDKMLYFVAPEWWRPRLHHGRQQLQGSPAGTGGIPPLASVTGAVKAALQKGVLKRLRGAELAAKPDVLTSSTVGWGGTDESARENYYITEESEPARFGSSLGWLLQLDGDNMRNAFLNAPWVKAVIPIRPGQEAAAINWLKGVEGMNGITDDVIYHAASPDEVDINGQPLDGRKMIDVLFDLAAKIQRKHQQGIETGSYPKPGDVSDPALVDDENTVTATPIDRVYEHGFFPLAGGFRANVGDNYEVFDQWTEILPTDQIVPVEVKYDPKTGRQI